MKRTVVVNEYEARKVHLSADEAQALAAHDAHVSIRPTGHDRWEIRPASIVGTITVGDFRLVVRPKIGMRNLLYLMDVTVGSERWRRDLAAYDHEPDLLAAMVRLYLHCLDVALSQGLRRDYRVLSKQQIAVRGRIDFARVARRPGPPSPIACTFDDYTPNVRINQLLLAALQQCRRITGIEIDQRERLLHHLSYFDEVSTLEGSLDWVDDWSPNHFERHYGPAVRIAALILRRLSVTDQIGALGAASFTLDMNALVEKFVEVHLARYLGAGLEISAQHSMYFDVESTISVKPDLVFMRNGKPAFVADCKYKVAADTSEARTADFFQIHSYASALGLKSGALISCSARAGDEAHERVGVRGTGIEIAVWPIDLTGGPDEIEASLRELAMRISREAVQHRRTAIAASSDMNHAAAPAWSA